MEAEERIEQATALWKGEEAPAPETVAAPAAGAEPAAGAAAAAAEAKPGEEPAKKEGESAKPADAAQPEAAPDVQKLAAELDSYKAIMTEGKIETPEQLKATLADALILYSVLDGQQKPRQLLEAVRTTQAPEVFQAMIADLKEYLGEQGTTPAAKGADQAAAMAADPKVAEQAAAEQARVQGEREKIVQNFEGRVSALAKKENLEADDIPAYSDWISRQIGKDPAMLKRLEAGKLNDVDELFTKYHNQQVARLERWSKSVLAKKSDAQKNAPKIPAGGAPPAPATPAKLPPAQGAEERTARAARILRGEPVQ